MVDNGNSSISKSMKNQSDSIGAQTYHLCTS